MSRPISSRPAPAARHGDSVQSFVYRNPAPMNLFKIEHFLDSVVAVFGARMMRYKGVIQLADSPWRAVFQGVHALMGAEIGARWGEREYRDTCMVFIGKDLPRQLLVDGLDRCVADAPAPRPMPGGR